MLLLSRDVKQRAVELEPAKYKQVDGERVLVSPGVTAMMRESTNWDRAHERMMYHALQNAPAYTELSKQEQVLVNEVANDIIPAMVRTVLIRGSFPHITINSDPDEVFEAVVEIANMPRATGIIRWFNAVYQFTFDNDPDLLPPDEVAAGKGQSRTSSKSGTASDSNTANASSTNTPESKLASE